MARNFYGAIVRTGGGIGALDSIDGINLKDLDSAFVQTLDTLYPYTLDEDSGLAEDGINVIIPDSNPGTKRWILQNIHVNSGMFEGSIELSSVNALRFGDQVTDGTWREIRSGTKLSFQRRENTAIATVASAPTVGGTGYTVGDDLTLSEGSGGTVNVDTVSGGVVTAVSLLTAGEGYTVGAGKATTGGTGTGCTIEILTVLSVYVEKGFFDTASIGTKSIHLGDMFTIEEDLIDNDGIETQGCVHIHNVAGVSGNFCLHEGTEPTVSLSGEGHRLWADSSNLFYHQDADGLSHKVITDDGSGNVGINTTPGVTFDMIAISGDTELRVRNNSSSNRAFLQVENDIVDRWEFDIWGSAASGTLFGVSKNSLASLLSNTDTVIGTISPDFIAIGTNNIERFRITSSGNVGIGTNSPFGKLHIQSSASGAATVSSNADEFIIEAGSVSGMTILGGTSSDTSIFFGDSVSQTMGRIVYDNNVDDLSLWTNASERLTITSGGDVGIGVTVPEEKLHVEESATGLVFPLKIRNTSSAFGDSTGILFSYGSGSDRGKAAIVFEGTGSWNRGDIHILQNAVGDATIASLNDKVFTIANDGNIGIGTGVPHGFLHLESSGLDPIDTADVGQYTFIVHSKDGGDGAEVGIGFSVFNAASLSTSDAPGAAITHERTGAWSAGKLHFKTRSDTAQGGNPVTRMTIDENGNMTMIGNINPEADGTRDLGTQTTAQWANIWSDLINGADFSYVNGWRTFESEKMKGYGEGIAFGNKEQNNFEDGRVTKEIEGKPIFAVTEDFIEYKGRRLTVEILGKLIKLAELYS